MAALTGAQIAITWAAGQNPAGLSITVPADAVMVCMFWHYFAPTNGAGLAPGPTLAGNAPDVNFETPMVSATFESAVGVLVWYNPPTGLQTLDIAWDAVPSDGPTTIVVFVTDADTAAGVRDSDAANDDEATPVSVTLTTVAGDLVLKYDGHFNTTAPGNSAGWTPVLTQPSRNNLSSNLNSIIAVGTTQVCNSENEEYSSLVAISIPDAEDAGGETIYTRRPFDSPIFGSRIIQ